MNNLAFSYSAAGKLDLALPLCEENLKLHRTKLGADHPQTLISMGNLAVVYDKFKKFDKTELLLTEQLASVKTKSSVDSPAYSSALAALGLNLLYQKKWTDAEPIIRECLAIREQTEPDEWRTFNAKSLLGGVLLGQKKYDEAEPLLLVGYEGLKLREAKIPPPPKDRLLREAVERLVQLYEATGKPDEADKWRKTLESQAGK